MLENGALISFEGDVYSYRGLSDSLLKKKFSLAVLEGDYALSANNCQADEIPAAQSVVETGWEWRGSGGGKLSEPGSSGVVQRAVEGCWRQCSV